MVENVTDSGESIYLAMPIADRAATSVFRAVDHILRDSPITGLLDVGASDGVANVGGVCGQKAVGIDISSSAAQANKTELSVQANALHLPFKDNSFSHILALDVVEHFPLADARRLLAEIQRVGMSGHELIVSMPLVDPTRIMAWVEGHRAIRGHQRPATGLFDRTHYILSGARRHLQLLQSSGYSVQAQYETIAHTSGVAQVDGPARVLDQGTLDSRPRIVQEYLRRQDHETHIAGILRRLLGYQRIYHLRSTS